MHYGMPSNVPGDCPFQPTDSCPTRSVSFPSSHLFLTSVPLSLLPRQTDAVRCSLASQVIPSCSPPSQVIPSCSPPSEVIPSCSPPSQVITSCSPPSKAAVRHPKSSQAAVHHPKSSQAAVRLPCHPACGSPFPNSSAHACHVLMSSAGQSQLVCLPSLRAARPSAPPSGPTRAAFHTAKLQLAAVAVGGGGAAVPVVAYF